MRQHAPFESIYLNEFEVVEQVTGATRLYPHTEQLPALSRAINLEFYGPLPNRIAHVDGRADDYPKAVLNLAANMFCRFVNGHRGDDLRLFPVLTPDRVTKVAIVQRISHERPRGALHHFRFFTGTDFCPDVLVSGKRLSFTDHVLHRFTERVPTQIGTDVTELLVLFFWSWLTVMTTGKSPAFVLEYNGSVLAFPFEETADAVVVTTCLTVREINSLHYDSPPRVFNSHYGPLFTPPPDRNWFPEDKAKARFDLWQRKVLPTPAVAVPKSLERWSRTANLLTKHADALGRTPGCRLYFIDYLPGLATVYRPAAKATPPKPPPTLAELTAAIAKDPGNHELHYSRSRWHNEHGDLPSALIDLDKAIELFPTGHHTYNERAWHAYQRGDYEAALRDIDQALRNNPSYSYGYDTRAWIHLRRGDLAAAEADCRRSLECAGENPVVHYTRGLLHYLTHDHPRAVAEWTQAVLRRPAWGEDLNPWIAKARQAASQPPPSPQPAGQAQCAVTPISSSARA